MLIALSLYVGLLSTTIATANLPATPEGGERFVKGLGCEVTIADESVSGPAGCKVQVATVTSDGDVKRTTIDLAHNPAPIEMAPSLEDQPEVDEDRPDTAPPEQPRNRTAMQPEQRRPQTTRSSPPPPNRTNTGAPATQPTALDLAIGPSFVVQRDWGDFGFSTYGFALDAYIMKSFVVSIRWDRGTGRTTTSILDLAEAVEQNLDILTADARYLLAVNARAHVYMGGRIGIARIETDTIVAERQQLSASKQSAMVFGPSIGLGYTIGAAVLRVGYNMLWATGDWYASDEFGATEGEGPTEHSGVLSQNLSWHRVSLVSIYVQLRYLSARTLSFVLLFSTMLCHQWGCGSSGGNLSDVPGIDAGEPTCGQCPEGEQCHPEARICVPCPNGECALGVDAGDIIPVVDMGPMDESDAADSESVDSTVSEADAGTDAESIPIDSEVVDAAMPQPDACAVTGDEACDGIDNDCDGIIDESFDVSADVNHCGGCGQACAERANADAACLDGACIFTCREGWLDNDNDPETGCEESAASISFSSPDDAAALRDNFTIRLEIVGAQQIALIELKANDQLLVRRAPMPIVEYEAIIADMPEGNVTLTAEYFDLDLESLGSVERMIIVDGTNPTLQFVNPMTGTELNQLDITANIRVNNEAGPVTVTLSQVTGNAVEFIADNQQNGSLPFRLRLKKAFYNQAL